MELGLGRLYRLNDMLIQTAGTALIETVVAVRMTGLEYLASLSYKTEYWLM